MKFQQYMIRVLSWPPLLVLLMFFVVGLQPATAQYTADFQTNIIDGVASNWSGIYTIGEGFYGDVLIITNAGVLVNSGVGNVGGSTTGNVAIVTGSGSSWTNNGGELYVGVSADFNIMKILDGGFVFCTNSVIFNGNNVVLIAGTGSVWYVNDSFGLAGTENSLIVSNGGKMLIVGSAADYLMGISNRISIVGSGSIFTNNANYFQVGVLAGDQGNQISVTDGGRMDTSAGDFYIGFIAADTSGVTVSGTGSVWNAAGDIYVGVIVHGCWLTITNGGAVTTPSALRVSSNTGSSSNTVTLAGGTLKVGSFLTMQPNNTINFNSCSMTVTAGVTTINNGSVLNVGLGTGNHPWVCTGNLTLDATLNVTDAGGFTVGSYILFTYGGTLSGNGLTIGTTPANFDYVVNTNTAGLVKLDVSSQVPIAGFKGYPTCNVLPVVTIFTDTSTGMITNRFWDFGDGSTTNFDTAVNPTHTYATAGTNTVILIVSGDLGVSTNTKTGYITAVAPGPRGFSIPGPFNTAWWSSLIPPPPPCAPQIFTSSGTLTVATGGKTWHLFIVGGGGPGGGWDGGGGGGGGVLDTNVVLDAGVYTVTVGGGAQTGSCDPGTNSSFGSFVALGGGHGGHNVYCGNNPNGGNGGSGGGAAGYTSGSVGAGTAGQGHDGGAPSTTGGGGGGAGAAGDPGSSQGGNGGVGVLSSISGTPTYYGGGGGGGVNGNETVGNGGTGGGGAGATSSGGYNPTPTPGTPNTGGGGGGGGGNGYGGQSVGAAGGFGIVIALCLD